ncbi:MAG: protein kinase [Myxococcales bacterium]|nr:protein kinase [Myxococcales bacterium]
MRARAPEDSHEGPPATASEGEPSASASAGPDSRAGEIIANRFRLVARIHTSSSGAVYRAEDLALARPVALRLLTPILSRDQVVLDRLQQRLHAGTRMVRDDARVLSDIVDVVDLGRTDGGQVFVVTDFIAGESLAEQLGREGPLPWPTLRPLMVRACQILHLSHEHGVVRLDLQTRHLFPVRDKTQQSTLKILSPGLHLDPALSPEMIRYAAPEQITRTAVDARTDVYSLGIIMYELLTGQVPFADAVPAVILARHLLEPPPSLPLHLRAVVPPAVLAIVQRALAKAPEDRWPTMRAMANALAAIDFGPCDASGMLEVVDGEPLTPSTSSASMRIDPSASMSAPSPAVRPRTFPPLQNAFMAGDSVEADRDVSAERGHAHAPDPESSASEMAWEEILAAAEEAVSAVAGGQRSGIAGDSGVFLSERLLRSATSARTRRPPRPPSEPSQADTLILPMTLVRAEAPSEPTMQLGPEDLLADSHVALVLPPLVKRPPPPSASSSAMMLGPDDLEPLESTTAGRIDPTTTDAHASASAARLASSSSARLASASTSSEHASTSTSGGRAWASASTAALTPASEARPAPTASSSASNMPSPGSTIDAASSSSARLTSASSPEHRHESAAASSPRLTSAHPEPGPDAASSSRLTSAPPEPGPDAASASSARLTSASSSSARLTNESASTHESASSSSARLTSASPEPAHESASAASARLTSASESTAGARLAAPALATGNERRATLIALRVPPVAHFSDGDAPKSAVLDDGEATTAVVPAGPPATTDAAALTDAAFTADSTPTLTRTPLAPRDPSPSARSSDTPAGESTAHLATPAERSSAWPRPPEPPARRAWVPWAAGLVLFVAAGAAVMRLSAPVGERVADARRVDATGARATAGEARAADLPPGTAVNPRAADLSPGTAADQRAIDLSPGTAMDPPAVDLSLGTAAGAPAAAPLDLADGTAAPADSPATAAGEGPATTAPAPGVVSPAGPHPSALPPPASPPNVVPAATPAAPDGSPTMAPAPAATPAAPGGSTTATPAPALPANSPASTRAATSRPAPRDLPSGTGRAPRPQPASEPLARKSSPTVGAELPEGTAANPAPTPASPPPSDNLPAGTAGAPAQAPAPAPAPDNLPSGTAATPPPAAPSPAPPPAADVSSGTAPAAQPAKNLSPGTGTPSTPAPAGPRTPPAPPRLDPTLAAGLLVRAEQSAARGEHLQALGLAVQSFNAAPTAASLQIAGVAACKLGNVGKAKWAHQHLAPQDRGRVVAACKAAGVPVP